MANEELESLMESYFAPSEEKTLSLNEIENMIKEVFILERAAPTGGRFSMNIPIPKLVPTESWGDPNSQARQDITRIFASITREPNIRARIDHVNSFLDPVQAQRKAPGGKINAIMNMMQIIESLQACLNDYNESSAGFVFEGFMAALTGGKQIAGRVGGTLPIEDFVAFTEQDGESVPTSLKLLSPKTGIHGSFTNLVDYLYLRGGSGMPKIKYIVAYKAKEGENVSKLAVWDFTITRENFVEMMTRSSKNNAALIGPMAQEMAEHTSNFNDSPEWRLTMAQILARTPGYNTKRGMFVLNLTDDGQFYVADEPETGGQSGSNVAYGNVAPGGKLASKNAIYSAAETAGFEHSRENGPDFDTWWASIPEEEKAAAKLYGASKATRRKNTEEVKKRFDRGVKHAEEGMEGNESPEAVQEMMYSFGSFHEREKQLMAEENALMEGGKGGADSGKQWTLTSGHITDMTSLLNTEMYGEINLSSQNIAAISKIFIEKLGEDLMALLENTKNFAENIGKYFSLEDRSVASEANRTAQAQGTNIVNSLAKRAQEDKPTE